MKHGTFTMYKYGPCDCPECAEANEKFKEKLEMNRVKEDKYKEVVRKRQLAFTRSLRTQILIEYGGACKCCGETVPDFLCVDHIFDDGAAHRREVGHSSSFYKWLKKNKFPKDRFQLLCWNCNYAKRVHGYCPFHKKISL